MNQSVTISGVIIMILAMVIEPSEAETVVNNVVKIIDLSLPIVGIIMTYWGRYRQGDINWYGGKV